MFQHPLKINETSSKIEALIKTQCDTSIIEIQNMLRKHLNSNKQLFNFGEKTICGRFKKYYSPQETHTVPK